MERLPKTQLASDVKCGIREIIYQVYRVARGCFLTKSANEQVNIRMDDGLLLFRRFICEGIRQYAAKAGMVSVRG